MGSRAWLEEIEARARAALDKPAEYGPDVDVRGFAEAVGRGDYDPSRLEEVGVDLSSGAYYLQVDQNYFKYLSRLSGVEVMSTKDFVENYPDEAREYFWRLIDPGADKYTALAALVWRGGYFIRVKKNARVEEPIMSCLYLSTHGVQAPHNVVVVEEGAQATVWTGCTVAPEAFALHVGISEFYVKEGARLTFVMIHAWNKATHIRPRTAVRVDRGGAYVSYYANLSHAKTLQTYPVVRLGEGAKAGMYSVLLGLGDAHIDYGGAAYLEGEGASAEIVSKALSRDRSYIVTRGLVVGRAPNTRGHLECRGLMLSPESGMDTIPQLQSHTPDSSLTHEASIGKLAEDEINYLVSKGFSRDEAVGLLIKGFVSVDVGAFPERVRKTIEGVEKLLVEKSL